MDNEIDEIKNAVAMLIISLFVAILYLITIGKRGDSFRDDLFRWLPAIGFILSPVAYIFYKRRFINGIN